jgi:murein DD-endopeptidase MepM/ murein hydrolase activator NlpD
MHVRFACLVIAAALAAWTVPSAAAPQAANGLTVSLRPTPEPLAPGSVGIVVVEAPSAVASLTGSALGAPIHFWPVAPGRWSGLIGIGLETAPGTYDVAVHGTTAAGEAIDSRLRIAVTARRFETRRLRVSQKFVTPPAAETARIQQDAALLARVFGAVSPERLWSGPFAAPVPGAATSSFGRLSVLNGQPNGRHQGADFRAASGTPILAPNGGRVVVAQALYFAGNTVILDHGLGLYSLFAHLSSTDVSVGAIVARGDRLGEAGATGRVTGPHLHWAVRVGPLSIDPLLLMAASATLPERHDVLSTR